MNFSTKEGQPLALYTDNTGRKRVLHVLDGDGNIGNKEKLDIEDIVDLIEEFIRKSKGRISIRHLEKLQKHLIDKTEPDDNEKALKKLYNDFMEKTKNKKELKLKDISLIPIFDPEEERKIFYICGMSGCGKSTFASDLIENYNKVFPKNKIYFFSNKKSDPVIDKHKNINRMLLNEELIEDPIELEEIRDSLVIFDDIEYCTNKKISEELDRLRDIILQQGRSFHISFGYISHLINNYKQTKVILNECHCVVLFPKNTTTYSLKYLLEKYYGFNKEDVNKLKFLPSRWVIIYKIPICVLHQRGAYMIE
jgi:adenylate kinase family enzyme